MTVLRAPCPKVHCQWSPGGTRVLHTPHTGIASLMYSSKACPRQRWLYVQCRHVLRQSRGDHLVELTHIVTTALQEKNMEVKPDYGYDTYVGHNKLKDKVIICHAFLHCAYEGLISRRTVDTPLFKDLPSAVAPLTPLTLAVAGRNNHWRGQVLPCCVCHSFLSGLF